MKGGREARGVKDGPDETVASRGAYLTFAALFVLTAVGLATGAYWLLPWLLLGFLCVGIDEKRSNRWSQL